LLDRLSGICGAENYLRSMQRWKNLFPFPLNPSGSEEKKEYWLPAGAGK